MEIEESDIAYENESDSIHLKLNVEKGKENRSLDLEL